MIKKLSLLLLFVSLVLAPLSAQQQASTANNKYVKICVAFYNQENLFDTIDGPNNDADFLPSGSYRWTSERYQHKLAQMSSVIAKLGTHGADILGVCEVENRGVLEDLINQPALKDKDYGIVHYDSPDRRGIDCALLYRKSIFSPTNSSTHFVAMPGEPNVLTRDVLHVEGTIDGEKVHFMVAHWPSRAGGEQVSLNRRMAAAKVMRSVADSVMQSDPNAKIIMMGDFNDDPTSPSVVKGLRLSESAACLQPNQFFTPMADMFKNGLGTLAYRDTWNLFDIMVFNGNLARTDYYSLNVLHDPDTGYYAHIFKPSFILQQYGRYKGYPYRTFAGGNYEGGYSDHCPVYLYLVKKLK